jgi:hypothetical protein
MSEIESPAAAVMPDASAPQVPEPVAPIAPEPTAPTNDQQQPDPNAPSNITDDEQAEWDEAAKALGFPGVKSTAKKTDEEQQPNGQDEQPKADEATTTTTTVIPETPTTDTTTVAPVETTEDGDEEAGQPDTSIRDSRAIAREVAQQLEETKANVREQLFGDTPRALIDKDGNEIKDVSDVMQYVNPATKTEENPEGRLFTREEADQWLAYQRSEINTKVAENEKEVERIANINIGIADQADSINEQYGEILKVDPELRAELWKQYSKTLVTKKGKDAEGKEIDIIVDAPYSLEEYYRNALEPRAEIGRQLEAQEAAQAAEAERLKQEQEKQRKESRQDRSDIYGGTGDKGGIVSDEAKEWDAAASAVFSPDQLNALKK